MPTLSAHRPTQETRTPVHATTAIVNRHRTYSARRRVLASRKGGRRYVQASELIITRGRSRTWLTGKTGTLALRDWVQYAGKGPRGGLQPIMLAGLGRIDRRAGRQRRSLADANDPTAHYHDYLRKGLGGLKEKYSWGSMVVATNGCGGRALAASLLHSKLHAAAPGETPLGPRDSLAGLVGSALGSPRLLA